MSETSLLLMQARYVLRNLDVERPECGYAKMAAACEAAAAPEKPWPSDGEMLRMLGEAGYDLHSTHPSCYRAFSWRKFTDKLKAVLT